MIKISSAKVPEPASREILIRDLARRLDDFEDSHSSPSRRLEEPSDENVRQRQSELFAWTVCAVSLAINVYLLSNLI
jgi:type VI protein secretion system component VasF